MPRNSTMSGFGGTEKIKDARPLHDKSFVQQCIRQLHEVKKNLIEYSIYIDTKVLFVLTCYTIYSMFIKSTVWDLKIFDL